MTELTRDDEEWLLAQMKNNKIDGSAVSATMINKKPEVMPSLRESPPKPTTPPKRKRRGGSFDEMILGRSETKLRQCAYIDKSLYLKISKIVNVATEKRITIGGYLDAIIEQHLEEHKDEINERLIRNIKI